MDHKSVRSYAWGYEDELNEGLLFNGEALKVGGPYTSEAHMDDIYKSEAYRGEAYIDEAYIDDNASVHTAKWHKKHSSEGEYLN